MSERKIETLDGGEHVRLRWSMYLDADPEKAIRLALRECWVNSCDELVFRKRKGTVKIFLNKEKRQMIVSDNGEGIPSDKLADAFLKVNTGSNFHNREGNLAGAMGVGLKAMSHTAEYVEVTSYNGKEETHMSIIDSGKDGILKEIKVGNKTSKESGLRVMFRPLKGIFGDSWIDEKALVEEIDEAAKFYPDLTFEIHGDIENHVISYPKGLNLKTTEAFYQSDSFILSLSLESGEIKPFANRLYMPDGGAFYTHFKTQLTRAINDTISFKINGSELQSALSGYVAVFVQEPVFSNQQKSAIGNKEVNLEITSAVKKIVAQLQASQNWQRFIKTLELEMKAAEAAEKARMKVKSARDEITKGAKKKVVAADKLKDCIEHGEKAWLAISEGDSAQGALNQGRDIQFVATFPIRGKFINCLKNSPEKFLDNEELKQIAQILGCDILEKYNANKLKYGKVLIAVDADSDGLNIACLLITFFYVCMPKFIQEGRLYWMKAPLYSKGNDYIFTEEDWSKVKNKKGFIRNKGLGQMDASDVEESLFGPQKQWVQLKPVNWQKFSQLIEDLMGKDVDVRREFLFNNINFENIKFL